MTDRLTFLWKGQPATLERSRLHSCSACSHTDAVLLTVGDAAVTLRGPMADMVYFAMSKAMPAPDGRDG